MNGQDCGNCRFLAESDGYGNSLCKRHGPSLGNACIGMPGKYHATWPIVSKNQWCGDWTPQPQPEVEPDV